MKGGKWRDKIRGIKTLAEELIDDLADGIMLKSREFAALFLDEYDIEMSANEAAAVLNRCKNVEGRPTSPDERAEHGVRKLWRVRRA